MDNHTKQSVIGEIQKCKVRRITMIAYLHLKQGEEDWHGVQDAASDLRDIDSEIRALEGIPQ